VRPTLSRGVRAISEDSVSDRGPTRSTAARVSLYASLPRSAVSAWLGTRRSSDSRDHAWPNDAACETSLEGLLTLRGPVDVTVSPRLSGLVGLASRRSRSRSPSYGGCVVIHEGAGDVKGRFKVVAVFGGDVAGHGRFSRWVLGFGALPRSSLWRCRARLVGSSAWRGGQG